MLCSSARSTTRCASAQPTSVAHVGRLTPERLSGHDGDIAKQVASIDTAYSNLERVGLVSPSDKRRMGPRNSPIHEHSKFLSKKVRRSTAEQMRKTNYSAVPANLAKDIRALNYLELKAA